MQDDKDIALDFTYNFNYSDTIIIMRFDGTYVNLNEDFCKYIGCAREDLINKTIKEIALWVDTKVLDLLLRGHENSKKASSCETWFQCADGKKICGLISTQTIFKNEEVFILFIIHDIAKQQKINEKLKSSEEKFSRIFYMSPDAIAIIKSDGTFSDGIFVEINQGFTKMSGYSAEEVIGKKPTDLDVWTDFVYRDQIVDKLCVHNEIRDIEVPFRHKEGHIVYCQLSICRLNFNDEEYYMSTVRDISARKQAEKEQCRQEEELLVSRNKLLAASGLASIAPWEYDPKTGAFEFDDEFYAVYGTDVAREGKFMPFDYYVKTFVYPDDFWLFTGEKEFLESNKPLFSNDVKHRIIRRDGEIRTILVRRNFVMDNEGKIIRVYGANQDITERVQIEEERKRQAEVISQIAYFDSLTKLANRHSLNKWLDQEMKSAREGKAAGVIFFIDLDDLKMVNDTYGHTRGDGIIAIIGRKIVATVGKEAFISRIGGDEFVVILQGKYNKGEIEVIAQAISQAVGGKQEYSGVHFHITASIGIAVYPSDGDTAEEIIKNADNAMFAAKEGGKNCWKFYTKAMQDELHNKICLTGGLRYALERGELSLVYQPQIVALTGSVIGFEALLRWHSSEYGVVPPSQFIPLAEQSGLIHSIGKWVLNEACFFVRRLTNRGWHNVRVAVNISTKQIAADDFVAIVCNAMQTANIQPRQLELEITENLLLTSIEDAIIKLTQLNNMGIHLSLDDFGTGFSSLTYLRRLPFKTLKIDKSFIDMIAVDATGTKIISSIISMAHTIDMRVIAEGVETPKQMHYLVNNNCDCIQGYIFSRPIMEDNALKLLSGEAGGNIINM